MDMRPCAIYCGEDLQARLAAALRQTQQRGLSYNSTTIKLHRSTSRLDIEIDNAAPHLNAVKAEI